MSKFGFPAVASFLVLSVPEDKFVFQTYLLPQSLFLISQEDTRIVSLIVSYRIQSYILQTQFCLIEQIL